MDEGAKSMKAIMLVAGKGTRLAPLTNYIPKCCLPIAGVPLLHIWLNRIMMLGIYDVLLNPSHFPYYIKASVMSTILAHMRVHLHYEKEPLGTAQTLRKASKWIDGDDFLVIYGDVLTNLNIRNLIKTHRRRRALITAFAYETTVPEEKGVFTVDSRGWATDFQEKPENPESNLAFSGVFVAKAEFLEHIRKKDVDLGFDVLPRVIKDGKNCFVYVDPTVYIKDIGTISDYLQCQTEWRKLNE